MYLKKLEILGFKSFANKTRITFASGVTAIVGPNGCGKTNILDSLRWVLGEQKVTLLRGGKMEEVIFNGSRDLKPLGMSEVSLTVVNNKGILPSEYGEVQITRRLFRSGESEYLLNKVPCRLKDITDLFVDTGMGAHSYSVIQQDMVEAILSNKAEERRFLFEEAAGITKYKQRKKAALRKLEATEQDFLRLKDIHAEVKTQVNSLYRQHKKAERYQRVANDIRQWELYLSATRIRKLEQEKREIKAQLDELSGKRTSNDTTLNQLSAELEARRKEQIDIERQLSEVGNTIYELSEKAHTLEREISVAREKKANAQSLLQKNETDIVTMQGRDQQLRTQMDEFEKELQEARERFDTVATELKEAETAQQEADERLLAIRRSREDKNRRLIELEGQLSSGRTEETNLRQQEEELTESIGKIDQQIEANRPQQKKLLEELDAQRSKLDELLGRKQQLTSRQSAIKGEMEQLVQRGEELADDISNLTASIEACEARKNLLEEMMLQYEGHGAGLVSVMDNRDRWSGIRGTVGELFVPAEGLELALETALGDMAKCVICNDRSTARDIINYLQSEDKGRIGILVPLSGTVNPAVKRPEISHPGFVGWLDSLVKTDESLTVLKQAVLARTAVLKAGGDVESILPHLPHGFAAVTEDGIMYHGNFITGGSEEHFSIFRRREKIEDQQKEIEQLTADLTDRRNERAKVTARQGALRAESGDISSKLEDIVEEIDTYQTKVGELDFQRRTLVSEFERLERERRSLSTKRESIRSRQETLGLDYGELTNLKEQLVTKMNEAGSRLEQYEQQAAAASERLSKLQVKSIETRSRVEQIESQITHTREIRQEIENGIATRRAENEQARRDIESCETRVSDMEEQLKAHFDERETLTEKQRGLRESQSEVMDRVSVREKEIRDIRDRRDSIGEQVHQIEIKINTIDSEVRSVRERIREEYDLDVTTIEAPRPEADFSDDQAYTHLQEQKEKLKKFGAVNLLALEEYETAAEREKFLGEQIADLHAAKTDLQATITRINTTARELFMQTFGKVRGNFKNLFVELFAGGEADISLTDDTDPLESPIEITARPRGKKLISIAQMSGGERALTAISLLFSLYLVKPSPFCILDEIDAPLDDANCHRFLKLIRSFSQQTQFVVITHNKITMEAADNLYGITMELPGVSTLVAVRFNDGGEVVTDSGNEERAEETPDRVEVAPEEEIPEAIRERLSPSIKVPTDEEQNT